MPYVPQMSFRRDSLGFSGDAIIFLTFLFSDHAIGLEFLKDTWLIRSKVQCNSSGRDMTWHADPSALDRFRWRCRRRGAGTRCSGSRSIRDGSWFQRSHLTLQEVLYLTYDIYHLAHYMFAARCNALGISQFTQFLAIAASTDWSSLPTTVTSPSVATWLTAVCPRETAASRYTGMSFLSR